MTSRLHLAAAKVVADIRTRPETLSSGISAQYFAELEAALAEHPSAAANLFWDAEDQEQGSDNYEDLFDDCDDQVRKIECAQYLKPFFVAFLRADEDYLEVFDTEAEAIAAFEAEGHRRAMLAAIEDANLGVDA